MFDKNSGYWYFLVFILSKLSERQFLKSSSEINLDRMNKNNFYFVRTFSVVKSFLQSRNCFYSFSMNDGEFINCDLNRFFVFSNQKLFPKSTTSD